MSGLRVRVSRDVELKDNGVGAADARRLVGRAARAALEAAGVAEAELSLALVDDATIERLNEAWLGRRRPTDVIAFSLAGPDEPPLGDIYIGVQEAERQAASRGIPLREELARLAIHGTLHVLGHDHPEEDGREQSPMWAAQERILAAVLAS